MEYSQNFKAFYLKYRPQTLNDLIGQDSVKLTLKAAIENQKLSHAYLLVGPRGSGKTSTARILAKMVNCKGENIPCNNCDACLSITDGSNLDLIEIDAASNRGIEDIRALRDRIKLAPSSLNKKVYIIDEVHMLTTEAFNALLKTLEEPPTHALFILATTDVTKLPKTILSRVQRLDFKVATALELREALSRIIKSENIDIDDEALSTLIKMADGSFRDGVKILDQIATSKEKITRELIEKTLKFSSLDETLKILEMLSERKTTDALNFLNNFSQTGADFRDLTQSLMELIRSFIYIKNSLGAQLVEPHFSNDDYQKLINLADKFSSEELIEIVDTFQESFEKTKFASIAALPLELAIVKLCSLRVQKEQFRLEDQKFSETREKVKFEKILAVEKMETESIDSNLPRLQQPTKLANAPDSSDLIKLREKWTYVCETVRPYNFSLEALLRSITLGDCTNSSVVIEVPYSFHQRILEAPKNRELLESILSDIIGRNMKISVVIGGRPEKVEDVANIEVAQDDEIIRAAAEIFNQETIN